MINALALSSGDSHSDLVLPHLFCGAGHAVYTLWPKASLFSPTPLYKNSGSLYIVRLKPVKGADLTDICDRQKPCHERAHSPCLWKLTAWKLTLCCRQSIVSSQERDTVYVRLLGSEMWWFLQYIHSSVQFTMGQQSLGAATADRNQCSTSPELGPRDTGWLPMKPYLAGYPHQLSFRTSAFFSFFFFFLFCARIKGSGVVLKIH